MKTQSNEIVNAARSTSDGSSSQPGRERLDSPERSRRISEAAYQRAEARGFTPGAELDDWLAAEREIDGDGASHGAGDGQGMRGESADEVGLEERLADGLGDGQPDAGVPASAAEQRKSEADALAQRSAREHSRRR